MSFNLRYGTAEDGPNSWPLRRQAAMSAIYELDADVVGLQEALAFQIEEILGRFPNYDWIGVGRDDGVHEGEFAPILFRRGKLQAVERGTFWFSSTPELPGSRHQECYHPRICTWARFESFWVYNLHLDNESSAARSAAVRQLLERVRRPALVMGDFNAGETDDCVEQMRAADFRDSYRIVQPDGLAGTYHGFGAVPAQEKIDYVWVDNAWNVSSAEVFTKRYASAFPSDHFPVVADVSLT